MRAPPYVVFSDVIVVSTVPSINSSTVAANDSAYIPRALGHSRR